MIKVSGLVARVIQINIPSELEISYFMPSGVMRHNKIRMEFPGTWMI